MTQQLTEKPPVVFQQVSGFMSTQVNVGSISTEALDCHSYCILTHCIKICLVALFFFLTYFFIFSLHLKGILSSSKFNTRGNFIKWYSLKLLLHRTK